MAKFWCNKWRKNNARKNKARHPLNIPGGITTMQDYTTSDT